MASTLAYGSALMGDGDVGLVPVALATRVQGPPGQPAAGPRD